QPVAAAQLASAPISAVQRKRSCLRKSFMTIGILTTIGVLTLAAFIAGGIIVFKGLNQAGALVVPTELSVQATEAAADGAVIQVGPRPSAAPTATVNPNDPIAVALARGRAACVGPGCPGGSADQSLTIYNAALAERPDSAALLAARAQLYVWWDSYTYAEQARADITAALASDPNSAAAYLARAGLAWATSEDAEAHKQALADVDQAITLDPLLTSAYLERARFLSLASDFYDSASPSRTQVIADTSTVLASEPHNAVALNLRAEAAYVESRPDDALADTDAALALNPKDFAALMRRARLNRFFYHKPDLALADFAAAIVIEPENAEAREGHAAMLITNGNNKEALADTEALLRITNGDPAALTFHGFLLLSLDRAPEAEQDFADALVAASDDIAARYGRGIALLAQDKPADAISDLEAALEHQDGLYYIYDVFSRSHPTAGLNLARAYMASGRMDEAGKLLDAAVDASRDWYLPYLVRSRYRRATGDLAGTRADLGAAADRASSPAEHNEVESERSRNR
ncbi:MAG: tetratricopeptide repeat protein, partial [Oscillochloris sp.]|nr:tetratricopeptide repeat protein [Oscillochloris sp.]